MIPPLERNYFRGALLPFQPYLERIFPKGYNRCTPPEKIDLKKSKLENKFDVNVIMLFMSLKCTSKC